MAGKMADRRGTQAARIVVSTATAPTAGAKRVTKDSEHNPAAVALWLAPGPQRQCRQRGCVARVTRKSVYHALYCFLLYLGPWCMLRPQIAATPVAGRLC